MKIAIVSDLHLGASDHMGRENTKTKIHTRLEDFLKSFDTVIDYVLDPVNDIGLFIIAGDIYKNNSPTNIQQREFAKRLSRLYQARKETSIVDGNHDVGIHIASAIAAIGELKIDCLNVYHDPTVIDYSDKGFGLVFIPYMHKERIESVDNYVKLVDEYYDKIAHCGTTILIGHQTVDGSVMVSGYSDLSTFNEIVVPQECLNKFDLAVFGHIHAKQVLGDKKNILVPGSIENNKLDEAKYKEKFFVVYDTDMMDYDFIPISVRSVCDISLDLKNKNDVQTIIMNNLHAIKDIEESIVKLTVQIDAKQWEEIDEDAIRSILSKAWYSMGHSIRVDRTHTVRNKNVSEELDPLAALKEWIKSDKQLKDIEEELEIEGSKIIKCCDSL